MKYECPICINKIAKDDEIILSCCNQKICKSCDSKNISDKCWICRQNTFKKTNDISIYYERSLDDPDDVRYLITKIENNIEDANDAFQMNIIIKSLFTDGCIFGEYNMVCLQNIENAIVELKNVNYSIGLVDESMYKYNTTHHNLLSLIIENYVFDHILGRPNIFGLLQAKCLLRISTKLINKNINYKYMTYRNMRIDDWCKYEHDKYKNNNNHKFCFYFYDEIIKCMNYRNL